MAGLNESSIHVLSTVDMKANRQSSNKFAELPTTELCECCVKAGFDLAVDCLATCKWTWPGGTFDSREFQKYVCWFLECKKECERPTGAWSCACTKFFKEVG